MTQRSTIRHRYIQGARDCYNSTDPEKRVPDMEKVMGANDRLSYYEGWLDMRVYLRLPHLFNSPIYSAPS